MTSITLGGIQETEWGEEAVLVSPYEAKYYIQVLPWKTYEEEVEEYGSLTDKMLERNDGELNDEMRGALEAAEAYDFPDDFATHVSWDDEISNWTIDANAFPEARKFWEYVGLDVSVSDEIDDDAFN